MQIFIGADHRGFELKNKLIDWLKSEGHQVEDCGNTKYEAEDDYVDFAKAVAEKIIEAGVDSGGPPNGVANEAWGKDETGPAEKPLGILICGSGVGVSVAANRFKGVVCALGFDADQVAHARENDHINCLSIPSDYIDLEKAKAITNAFLTAQPKQGEKYLRRLKKLDN